MVSLIKKIKKMYKGSYYYANKKYGKYTKRRPFPNFNDFDCSPSGEFSMKEVPDEFATSKSNNYITDNSMVTEVNNNQNITYNITSNVSSPNNSITFEKSQSNSISPVTTISDSNTDFTMVNSTVDYYTNTSNSNPFNTSNSNPFNNTNMIKNAVNPFYDSTETSIFDDENAINDDLSSTDYYGNKMRRLSCTAGVGDPSEDEIKYEYNGNNNWKVEIKRYYPSMSQTTEPDEVKTAVNSEYNYDEYRQNTMPELGNDMGMEMKKKKKWWKKIIPNSSKHNNYTVNDNTFYDQKIGDDDNYQKNYSGDNSYYTNYNETEKRARYRSYPVMFYK